MQILVSVADQLIRTDSNPTKIKFTEAVKSREIFRNKTLLPEHVIGPCESCKVT